MKKIDLHIHTTYTISDSKRFDFSMDTLKDYVSERKLDAIAITNHNIFDRIQFEEISNKLEIDVFPGVEVDLCGGHLLMITENINEKVKKLDESCVQLARYIKKQADTLNLDEFFTVFPHNSLKDYILIPHYDKKPALSDEIIIELSKYSQIDAGEVSSAKKFVQAVKKKERLTPVFFSDSRMIPNLDRFSNQQTYVDIDEMNLNSLRYAFKDKNKLFLSEEDGHELFNVSENIKASTGLNIVLGERSSGKTYTLNELFKNNNKVKYIKQFELVEQNPENSEEAFKKRITDDESIFRRNHLDLFSKMVERVSKIDITKKDHELKMFCESLLSHAENIDKQDSFSKAYLFHETDFNNQNLDSLEKLINSVKNIIDNVEYKNEISKYVNQSNLKSLIKELIRTYREKHLINSLQKITNEAVKKVQSDLQLQTSIPKISDIKFTEIAREIIEVEKFNSLVKNMKSKKIIKENKLYSFTVIGKRKPFEGAGELRSLSKSRGKFSDAFSKYDVAFDFLQELKNIDTIDETEYYKYFFKIEFKILNEFGFEVSGGERAEFNFLKKIEDSLQYDMLLIDEPESSFDNIFLNNKINCQLKDISNKIPVFVVTHNNTIGASIHPDYIIHTKKIVEDDRKVKFVVYSGFPTDTKLKSKDGCFIDNIDAQLDCLEAGKESYLERNRNYEILGN